MKFPSRRTARHLALVLCAAASLSVLLIPGCGGGSNAVAPLAIPISTFDLGNGQSAKLALTGVGSTLSGTITIANLPAASTQKTTRALNFQIPTGTYPVSGTLTGNGGFAINGTFPAPLGAFNLSGTLPTQNNTGTFNLSANGQSVSGTIPSLSSIVPTTTATTGATATTAPTATRVPTTAPTLAPGISRIETASFVRGTGFNGSGLSAGNILRGQTPTFSNATTFSASNIRLGGDNNILFEGPNLNRAARVGDSFALGNRNASTGILYYQEPGNKFWESTGGTLKVTAVSAQSVSFSLSNVSFAPQSFGTTSAKGTFTLGGTGVFNG